MTSSILTGVSCNGTSVVVFASSSTPTTIVFELMSPLRKGAVARLSVNRSMIMDDASSIEDDPRPYFRVARLLRFVINVFA